MRTQTIMMNISNNQAFRFVTKNAIMISICFLMMHLGLSWSGTTDPTTGLSTTLEPPYYEDEHPPKSTKSYIRDPWIWGYSKEFAERFHMPLQWIEPNLKGALAVTFRMMTIGNPTCGLGGQVENCWPVNDCQLEVYYDNKIALPWTRPDIMRDSFMHGISAIDFLDVPEASRVMAKYRDVEKTGSSWLVGVENSPIFDGGFTGWARLAYYDREVYQGLGVISWHGRGVCPEPKGNANIYFYSFEARKKSQKSKSEKQDAQYMHRIFIPESYWDRARVLFKKQDQSNQETVRRLEQDFIKNNR